MTPIQSIFIPYIRAYWTPELIATFLYDSGIVAVGKMEIYSSYEDEYEYKCAVIEVGQWLDTEDAYEFICSLKYNGSAVMNISDEFWIVYNQPKMEHVIDLLIGEPNVTYFTLQNFEQWESMAMELEEDDKNMDELEEELEIMDEELLEPLDEELKPLLVQDDEEEFHNYLYDLELSNFIEMNMSKYCDAISSY